MSTFIHGLPASIGPGLSICLLLFQVVCLSEWLSRISWNSQIVLIFSFTCSTSLSFCPTFWESSSTLFSNSSTFFYICSTYLLFSESTLFSNCFFFHSNLFLFYRCNRFSCLSEDLNYYFSFLLYVISFLCGHLSFLVVSFLWWIFFSNIW